MKATVHFYSRPSTKARARQFDCEDIKIEIDMPFIPTVGMMLMVGDGPPEAVTVDQVWWDSSEPDRIDVFGEEPEEDAMRPWAEWKRAGWVLG